MQQLLPAAQVACHSRSRIRAVVFIGHAAVVLAMLLHFDPLAQHTTSADQADQGLAAQVCSFWAAQVVMIHG